MDGCGEREVRGRAAAALAELQVYRIDTTRTAKGRGTAQQHSDLVGREEVCGEGVYTSLSWTLYIALMRAVRDVCCCLFVCSDGSLTIQWENATMMCLIVVFVLAL